MTAPEYIAFVALAADTFTPAERLVIEVEAHVAAVGGEGV